MKFNVTRTDGKDNSNEKYLVVNVDEPYAGTVADLIEFYERKKGTWEHGDKSIREIIGINKETDLVTRTDGKDNLPEKEVKKCGFCGEDILDGNYNRLVKGQSWCSSCFNEHQRYYLDIAELEDNITKLNKWLNEYGETTPSAVRIIIRKEVNNLYEKLQDLTLSKLERRNT